MIGMLYDQMRLKAWTPPVAKPIVFALKVPVAVSATYAHPEQENQPEEFVATPAAIVRLTEGTNRERVGTGPYTHEENHGGAIRLGQEADAPQGEVAEYNDEEATKEQRSATNLVDDNERQ
jgi:hypothetical protein